MGEYRSSLAMEAEGAKTVWNRSIEKHNIRYKWMVSAVESTYDSCKVENLDCVGHVQKRTGKHLMNLKSSTTKDGCESLMSKSQRNTRSDDKVCKCCELAEKRP